LIFTEFKFLFFYILVFALYWSLKTNKTRKIWLLFVSYFFYASWDPRFLVLIIISTIVDYVTGFKIYNTTIHSHRKYWLTFSLVTNLGLLGIFKYYNFFIEPMTQLLNLIGVHTNLSSIKIILPVGISFYTFQSLSYSLDIFNNRIKPNKSILDFSLFVSFFPQLVAGPIVRAKAFLPQLKKIKSFYLINTRKYILLFLSGFFKKAVVADNIAYFSDSVFKNPDEFSTIGTILGVISYSIQIYCDFSGYSDMAIASAGLLGYELPINFNFPYLSSNISMFWKRWHISLSTWLMDYLFLPLVYSISKEINIRKKWHIKNEVWAYSLGIIITMLLCGLWHGSSWRFVVWGGLHGIAILIHRTWTQLISKHNKINKIIRFLGIPITFYFVSATWIIFRAPNPSTSFILLKKYILFYSGGIRTFPIYLFFIIFILFVLQLINSKFKYTNIIKKTPDYIFYFIIGITFFFINFFSQYAYKPFIYFQF